VKAIAFCLLSQILVAQAPVPAPAPEKVEPQPVLKARYAWGYSGMEGEGKGTLNILLDPGTDRVVLELYGLSERFVFLSGDRSTGYRIQIPRRELDMKAAHFSELPLPFLPQLGSPEALRKLLTEGSGPGVKVTKRDGKGPVKLSYSGQDEHGKDVMVWLQRTRWDVEPPKPE
jgi:hypothetical protein